MNLPFFLTSPDSCIFIDMKRFAIGWLFAAALATGCERKISADDVKENLEKAMANHLENSRPPGSPPMHFQILDVAYYEIGPYYRCEFKVKLLRADGTDTTGIIRGKISKDFSQVIK
jgi:hypothetical protein